MQTRGSGKGKGEVGKLIPCGGVREDGVLLCGDVRAERVAHSCCKLFQKTHRLMYIKHSCIPCI